MIRDQSSAMLVSLLFGATAVVAAPTVLERDSSFPIQVSKDAPEGVGAAILQPFVSFSIEFSSFPDFAGIYILASWWPPPPMQ